MRKVLKKVVDWVVDHDNKLVFVVLYISISLVLSITISLFWLLFAVLLHMGLEVIRQSKEKEGFRAVFLESLWETKVDFALVAFALWLVVYLDFIFGIAGLGVAARAGVHGASRAGRIGSRLARLTARFAAWQRVIRSILLSLDDVVNLARILHKGRSIKTKKQNESSIPKKACIEETPNANADQKRTSWSQKWTLGDYLGLGLLILFVLLVVSAPWFTNQSYVEIKNIILKEFDPFPKK